MQTIELSAGAVAYREVGAAGSPVLVFVHGFLVDQSVWADVPDRLAAQGFRCLVPTWPLGSHRHAIRPDADLSPRGLARLVLEFVDRIGPETVTLVGNDSGGAICQLVLAEDPGRVSRLVLTNCDAHEVFPPFPFDQLFRLARHPRLARALLGGVRWPPVRHSPLAFGWLVDRKLDPAESAPWVAPYLADPAVREDVAAFVRAWTGDELIGLGAVFAAYDRPVLIAWGQRDRFFRVDLGRRLAADFPDARMVEIPDARTFVALDQPERLAAELAGFLAGTAGGVRRESGSGAGH